MVVGIAKTWEKSSNPDMRGKKLVPAQPVRINQRVNPPISPKPAELGLDILIGVDPDS